MPKKPKGYGKRGRPTAKQVRNLRFAKALLEAPTVKEAYKMTHPNCKSEDSASVQSHRMITPEVVEEMRRILQTEQIAPINKENLVKLFMLVITGWQQGTEKTSDMLRAMEALKELVPDFKDRKEITTLSESELDQEINRLARQLNINTEN